MNLELLLKNYRCFPESHPARFSIGGCFVSFIGINNCGKSSLLKFFYEFRGLFTAMTNHNTIMPALMGQRQTFSYLEILDQREVFSNGTSGDLAFRVELSPPNQQVRYPSAAEITVFRNTNQWILSLDFPSGDRIGPTANLQLEDENTVLHAGQHFDISTVRTTFGLLANTLYVGPFRNAINVGSDRPYYDLDVGQALVKRWRSWKTGQTKDDNEAASRLTNEIRQIFGFRTLEINDSADERTLQLLINDRSYKLHEVGSGIAQFIIVLAHAATRRPALVLIDEPESNLHPSLQLDFLTTLGSYASDGVVFSTHSIGLARAAGDKIYALRLIDEGESLVSTFESTPGLAELLGELSFSGYQELGFEDILLVEGRTDVKTFQQFLRHRGRDHQILAMPLGGSDMINAKAEDELRELTRITPKISAVVDSERESEGAEPKKDRKHFKAICDRLGIKCLILQRRSTENYFSDQAVKAVKGAKYSALSPYEKLSEKLPSWGKAENWRIAREMKRGDLNETDLGPFLDAL